MNDPNPSATYFTQPGYGNFGVTIHGHDTLTTQTQFIAQCLGLGMALLSFPLAVYVSYDMFLIRRRQLFIKRKDRYRASDSAKQFWKRMPKVAQSAATVLLWPLFFSPQPSECLVIFMAIDNLAALTWHILMLTNTGSTTLRSMVYVLCPVFSSGSLLLHLVGIMRAIPVSSQASLFVSQKSFWQDLLFRLKVPSPGILTAVVFVYALVHLPLAVSQAWHLGSATSWPEMLYYFQMHWRQWALWLTLFSITATVYGLQLIWLLNMNAKDRKALGRDGGTGVDGNQHGDHDQPQDVVPATDVQKKLVVAAAKMVHRSLSGKLPPSSSSPISAPGDDSTLPALSVTVTGNLDDTLSIASVTSTHNTLASGTSSSPSALLSISSPPGKNNPAGVPLRKRPAATAAEAQRKRALRQVKQILVDSPAVTMLYVPIHILMVYAYGELATNPHAARSWQFIVPVVANILAYSGAQLKIFLPLFIVVWRDRQSRLVANARMSKVSGNGAAGPVEKGRAVKGTA